MVAQKVKSEKVEPQKKEEPKKKENEKPTIQTVWPVQINKFGDIHFRKAMLESLKLTSKLEPLQNLTMTFRLGSVTIVAEAKA